MKTFEGQKTAATPKKDICPAGLADLQIGESIRTYIDYYGLLSSPHDESPNAIPLSLLSFSAAVTIFSANF